MRIITLDDFLDTYFKVMQRGKSFLFSKFTLSNEKRTKSAFSNSSFESSNFWSIPKVQERWNVLTTGDKNKDFIAYLANDFFKGKKHLRLLSIGSGISNREIELASYSNIFKEVVCVDIAENLLKIAAENAKKKNINNIQFVAKSIDDLIFEKNEFDIVFFKASLHHFNNIDEFLSKKIKAILKPNGYLIINEFVGVTRHQFSKNQINAINKGLQLIPKKYKKRFKSNFHKNKYRGVGVLRMIIADPSECVDSSSIMPAIHKHFKTVIEKPYGGNLLMSVLRDISHHFYELNAEKEVILNELFELEDNYLQSNTSDFVFGIYKKTTQ